MSKIKRTAFNPFIVFSFIYFYPLLVEIFYAQYSDREFHIHLGWCAISIAYCFIFTFKMPVVLWTAFFTLTSLFDISYAMIFKSIFTSSSIESLAHTDHKEAIEFLGSYFTVSIILTECFYLITSFYLLIYLYLPGLPKKGRLQLIPLLFFVVLCIFLIKGLLIEQRYTKLLPGIVGAYPAYRERAVYNTVEMKERHTLVKNTLTPFANSIEEQQIYVFIIGEAAARAHMEIYGYPRPTTPHLSKQQDLLLFNDVISNFVQTLPSLRYTLTHADIHGGVSPHEALSIVDAANIAGLETWWISNQQPLRGTYSVIGSMATQATFLSNKFYGMESGRHDELILPELDKALNSQAPKKAIFIHLMGSHLKYSERYPETFNQFNKPPYYAYTASPNKHQQHYINTYDNSILYTDWLLYTILGKVDNHAGIAAISYIADHGEEVFDHVNFKGHGPDNVTKNSLDIPFIVWLSPDYKDRFAEKYQTLKQNINKPFMLNDYFQFCLTLMNITSPFESTAGNLFNQPYQKRKRLVYGKDYDIAFKQEQ